MYLLRLRRRPVWISSTLFWGASAKDLEVNVPLRMIRPSWLLLLHLFVVLLAALAIGRPAIKGGGGVSSRVVYVIDRSASMSAKDGAGGATRLEEAVDYARRSIRTLRSADAASAAIVTFASSAEIASALTNDWGSLEGSLDAVSPTDDPDTGIGESFDLLRALLLESAEESGPAARVVVLSDGAPEPAPEAALPGAIVEFVRVGPDPAVASDNLGIVALAARRAPDAPSTVRAFVRVMNASAARREAIVTLSVDGVVAVSRAVAIDPAGPGSDGSSIVADLEVPGASIITARIERPDVLASDNTASVAIDEARVLRVLLVCTTGDAEADGEWPILDVIREIPRTTVRTISGSAWGDLASTADSSSLFADLVILGGVEPGWARSRRLSVPIMSFGVLPVESGVTLGPPAPGRLIAWDRDHLLTRHLALDSVVFSGAGAFESSLGGSVVPIAWSEDGVAIACADDGAGRWLSVAFDASESNWPLQPSWPLFVENAVEWLTRRGERETGRVWRTGETITLVGALPGTTYSFGGVGAAAMRTIVSGGLGELVIPAQHRQGEYVAASDSPRSILPVPVAVLSESESLCRTSDRISIGAVPVESTFQSETPTEIWPWFLAALVVLLTFEWVLFVRHASIR